MHESPSQRLWVRTRRLTAALLVVWLLLNLLGPWFARDLNALQVMGFPLGFWLAAQGALMVYLAIIVIYVWRMHSLEADSLGDGDPARDGPGSGSA